jgi:predicted nuclease with TOPRIM domain
LKNKVSQLRGELKKKDSHINELRELIDFYKNKCQTLENKLDMRITQATIHTDRHVEAIADSAINANRTKFQKMSSMELAGSVLGRQSIQFPSRQQVQFNSPQMALSNQQVGSHKIVNGPRTQVSSVE